MKVIVYSKDSNEQFPNTMGISTNAETLIVSVNYEKENTILQKNFMCGEWNKVEIEP
jgi:hypothetical protein